MAKMEVRNNMCINRYSIIHIYSIVENHLHGLLGDIYFAGSDTISSTLSFLTLYLSKSPLVLKQLQQEIYNVTKNKRSTTLDDRERLE